MGALDPTNQKPWPNVVSSPPRFVYGLVKSMVWLKYRDSSGVDINIQCLEVCRGVDETNIARLNQLICHDKMFLIRRHFEIYVTEE